MATFATRFALAAASVAATSPSETSPAASASFCDQSGWSVVWSDEFDGPSINTSAWQIDDHLPAGNSRTRAALALAGHSYVEDGHLVLRSNATWTGTDWTNLTSGAIESVGKVSFQGIHRVCVSAKLPGGAGGGDGIWPAHWMMPDDKSCWPCHGEIDIMEMIRGDGILHGTYHWCVNQTCGDGPQHLSSGGQTKMPADWATAWHEFGVEYSQSGIKFALDGEVYHSPPSSSIFWAHTTPYYVILNTAVGGPWPGPPSANTTFPAYHQIDYVRVAEPTSVESSVL